MLKGSSQGLHGWRGQLQTLQQCPVSQQMALAARLIQFSQ
jgi:hypothetical protein